MMAPDEAGRYHPCAAASSISMTVGRSAFTASRNESFRCAKLSAFRALQPKPRAMAWKSGV
jgi:hypothetical protein